MALGLEEFQSFPSIRLTYWLFVSVIRRRGAVAVYQFTGASNNRDVSGSVNPPAIFVGVYYSVGPDKRPRGALSFRGTSNSYVLIPNNGCLDIKFSMTIIFWVYPRGRGPLIHFNPNGRGVDMSIDSPFKLSARFVPRSGKSVRPVSKTIPSNRWSYIAASYDYSSGLASLWSYNTLVDQRRIGRFRLGLATNYPIYIGRKPGDRRRFRGEISCLQIYNFAMTGPQIRSKMARCYNPGLHSPFFS